jgi:hypothetical protein
MNQRLELLLQGMHKDSRICAATVVLCCAVLCCAGLCCAAALQEATAKFQALQRIYDVLSDPQK